ncbi:signal peptidase I SipW [Bacillus sinesaloumensis]|uniref:signal peptidase I SipW n=1 Tax=Litchfieldia sinesaloumensis TaxID=1926280 RepID=UPI001151E552|nr:signal peptidase I [Bacillus sinesaloumensis]
MNKKKIFKWLNHLVTGLLIVLLICVASLVVTNKLSGGEPSVFGYQLKTVLSGSMEPGIKTGSIIAVKTGGDMTRFKENDVITFMEEDEKLITHRIVEVIDNGQQVMYRTKGDNNNTEDINPVLAQNVVAEYRGFTIPYLGYFADFADSKKGTLILMIVPGILIFLYSIFSLWRTISKLDISNKTNDAIEETKTN